MWRREWALRLFEGQVVVGQNERLFSVLHWKIVLGICLFVCMKLGHVFVEEYISWLVISLRTLFLIDFTSSEGYGTKIAYFSKYHPAPKQSLVALPSTTQHSHQRTLGTFDGQPLPIPFPPRPPDPPSFRKYTHHQQCNKPQSYNCSHRSAKTQSA